MTLEQLRTAIIPDTRGRAVLCDEWYKPVRACLDAAIAERDELRTLVADALDLAVGTRDDWFGQWQRLHDEAVRLGCVEEGGE